MRVWSKRIFIQKSLSFDTFMATLGKLIKILVAVSLLIFGAAVAGLFSYYVWVG